MFATLQESSAQRYQPSSVYHVYWRLRADRPWHSEELPNRFSAHDKYFALIERGYEAYLERRQRALAPA